MVMNEKACKTYITEPNGLRLTVARAINGGDFQACQACKGCAVDNCDDGEGY